MELADLYRDVIVDHNRRPRNFGKLAGATHMAEGNNPLCGDKLHVFLEVKDDTVRDIRFEGSGCAISTASASMMTQAVKGRSRAEAERLFGRFHDLVTGRGAGVKDGDELGKLAVFSGVSEFPVRVKCATLAWHTLQSALAGKEEAVSTE